MREVLEEISDFLAQNPWESVYVNLVSNHWPKRVLIMDVLDAHTKKLLVCHQKVAN